MKTLALGLLGLGLGLLPSGCGSTELGDETCTNAKACGGDVTGSWKVSSSCLTVNVMQMMNSSCPGATASVSGFKIDGTVSYGADLTYTSMLTVSGNVIVTEPASCLTVQGITLTCAQLQQAVQANLADGGFSSGTCAEASGGCSCTLVLIPDTTTESGTYTTSGAGVLTQTVAGGTPDTSDYCVSGSRLTVSPHASSGASSAATVTGTITFAKQ
ncbi:MAG TPA: hypothetical protein VNG33_24645 [Polyangiaceae bacterium]|nr:hypothetical protein [Polyangiaceae bacterium]